MRRDFAAAAVVCVAGLAWASPVLAKPARCFTSDDGYYACNFRATDRAGSFTISARGKPTYTLEVDGPGFAYGFANFGDRNVSLPGQYVRSNDDPACWSNPETNTKICAW